MSAASRLILIFTIVFAILIIHRKAIGESLVIIGVRFRGSVRFLCLLTFEQYFFIVIIFHYMNGMCIQLIHGIHKMNVIVFHFLYRDGILSRIGSFLTM